MIEHATCKHCGIAFSYERTRKFRTYCSRLCSNRHGEKRQVVTCRQCGAEFRGRLRQQFCSFRCAGKSKVHLVVARNKARRIYPENGLSTQKNHYRAHRVRLLSKDKNLRLSVIRLLGGQCAHCGYDDMRALVLDHKNSDGHIDRRRLGHKIARYYIHHLDEAKINLQVLCANCNLIKQSEADEHNKTRRVA